MDRPARARASRTIWASRAAERRRPVKASRGSGQPIRRGDTHAPGGEGDTAQDPYRFVSLTGGSEISCHALLIATGVSYRKLDAPGVERLTGAGVYYGAAITEAMACRGKDVFIVGAGTPGQAAYLSRYASSVTLVER